MLQETQGFLFGDWGGVFVWPVPGERGAPFGAAARGHPGWEGCISGRLFARTIIARPGVC